MTRRGYLTKTEWAAMLERQGGKCACGCGRTPDDGRFEADHSTPNTWEAGKPDQLLFWRCHRIKTKSDMREIEKWNGLCPLDAEVCSPGGSLITSH